MLVPYLSSLSSNASLLYFALRGLADSSNYSLQSIFSSGLLLGSANREAGYKERGEALLLPFASIQCCSSSNWATLLPPRSETHLQRDPFPEILASDNPSVTHVFFQARGGSFLLLFSLCYLSVPILLFSPPTPVKPIPYIQYSLWKYLVRFQFS